MSLFHSEVHPFWYFVLKVIFSLFVSLGSLTVLHFAWNAAITYIEKNHRNLKKYLIKADRWRTKVEIFLVYSKLREVINILQFTLSLLSVILYIYGTYLNTTPRWYSGLDVTLTFFFVMFWVLELYLSKDRLRFIYSGYSIVDILTVTPVIFEIGANELNTELTNFRFLRVLRVIRVLRIDTILHMFSDEISKYISKVTIYIFCYILILAGLYMNIEQMNMFDTPRPFQFHEAVYFIVVTVSTVGYGDIHPVTPLGMCFVVVALAIGVIFIPYQASQLMDKFARYSPYTRDLSGTSISRHVVVCGDISHTGLLEFLNEFYSEKQGKLKTDVVLMAPRLPSEEIRALLNHPFFANKVSYLQASPLVEADLKRAKVADAEAVFIFSPAAWSKGDSYTIMNALAALSMQGRFRVFAHLIKSESQTKLLSAGVRHYLCMEDFRMSMLAQNCLCPGFSTMMSNLFTSRPRGIYATKSDLWLQEYTYGSAFSIFRIKVPTALHDRKFSDAVIYMYFGMGALPIGVEESKEGDDPLPRRSMDANRRRSMDSSAAGSGAAAGHRFRRIALNPFDGEFILRDTDYLIVVSQSLKRLQMLEDGNPDALEMGVVHHALSESYPKYSENPTPRKKVVLPHLLEADAAIRRIPSMSSLGPAPSSASNSRVKFAPSGSNSGNSSPSEAAEAPLAAASSSSSNGKPALKKQSAESDINVPNVRVIDDSQALNNAIKARELSFDDDPTVPSVPNAQKKTLLFDSAPHGKHSIVPITVPANSDLKSLAAIIADNSPAPTPSSSSSGSLLETTPHDDEATASLKQLCRSQFNGDLRAMMDAALARLQANNPQAAQEMAEVAASLRSALNANLESSSGSSSPQYPPSNGLSSLIPSATPLSAKSPRRRTSKSPHQSTHSRFYASGSDFSFDEEDCPFDVAEREKYNILFDKRTVASATRKSLIDFGIQNHILLCGGYDKIEGFVLPLRARFLSLQQAIVILSPQEPTEAEWTRLGWFPDVYIVKGSPKEPKDLIRCNVSEASRVIILSDPYTEKNDVDMIDSDALLAYLDLRQDVHESRVLIELVHETNLKYLRSANQAYDEDSSAYKSQLLSGNSKMPDVQEYLSKNASSTQPTYYLTPEFASGRACAFSMLDSLMCKAFFQDYLFEVAHQLVFGLNSAPPPKSSDSAVETERQLYERTFLSQVDVPDSLHNATYGELFKEFVEQRGLLPLGLYRCRESTGAPVPYVFTCPPEGTPIHGDDRIFCLSHNPALLNSFLTGSV